MEFKAGLEKQSSVLYICLCWICRSIAIEVVVVGYEFTGIVHLISLSIYVYNVMIYNFNDSWWGELLHSYILKGALMNHNFI